jgi:hypothetical protein
MNGSYSTQYLPTVADVERIVALGDPVMRNLHITQSYHELALAMTARTGVCTNWCTFATWASRQAGQTIRKEDFARLIEAILQNVPAAQSLPDAVAVAQAIGATGSEDDIQESVFKLLNPLAALDRAADAVGQGNKKVFEEIGREFARFAAACLHDEAFDPDSISRFCEGLLPGEPPDGQHYLRQAFTRYYQAFFENDAKTRAELILLANIEIGLHEQTRLQPEIAAALDAALIDRREFRGRLIKALFPRRGWWARLRLFFLRLFDRRTLLDKLLDPLLMEARRRAHLVVTECLLNIGLPHGARLRLGRDVGADFPPSLQVLTLADLLALLDTIDPTPDSTRNTGAVDWAQLPQRMHFIADMFRCYHEAADLFEPPFTGEQVDALKAGQRPTGQL